jgi:hypothetical protein
MFNYIKTHPEFNTKYVILASHFTTLESNKLAGLVSEQDPTTDDFDEYEEDNETEPTFLNIFITKEQVEQLLSKGQVDVEPIEEECIDCGTELTIFPTLVLND